MRKPDYTSRHLTIFNGDNISELLSTAGNWIFNNTIEWYPDLVDHVFVSTNMFSDLGKYRIVIRFVSVEA